ncbi:oxidoreductase [Streptomyces sp. C]|nr:oxidoreductase [Streptomyces sp. C]
MRAMAYGTYGGTEVLAETRLPVPKVAPGEVLVRVRCAAVNPVDWKIMSGGLDGLMDTVFPVVPGWDVSGTVERVGIDAPEFAVGDAVMGYARKDWVHGGTFAEFVSVPVRCLAAKPVSLDWRQAAGLPLAGLTAYQLLTRLGTGRGDTVLVHGAAGGVGTLGVQIAAALGARVIGTASPRNHDRLRGLGCEPVAYGDGLTERVRALRPRGRHRRRRLRRGRHRRHPRRPRRGRTPRLLRRPHSPWGRAASGCGSAPSRENSPPWAASPTRAARRSRSPRASRSPKSRPPSP